MLVYHMYRDVQLQWRWRLLAGNNRIIAVSGEGYISRVHCEHAIRLVKFSAPAPVYQV